MSLGHTHGRSIELRGVSKSWDGTAALENVDIDVPPGTFTVLLGPSGCGKSTSLRIMAGLELADAGSVRIDGADVTTLAPAKRDVAMVFQSYALFPHLNVAENILFGLKVRRVGKAFVSIPKELDEAARVEGVSFPGLLWRVYVPLARPTYLAYGLVSVSHHWNNFPWPLIITTSVETRPVTVGLSVFAAIDSGVEWSVINAATLMTSGPLLLGFLLFQRQFVQSFMRAGIR